MKMRLTLAKALMYAGAYWAIIATVAISIRMVYAMLEHPPMAYYIGLCGAVLMLAGLLLDGRKGGR